VWRRRLRRGNKLLIHRPHQIYELILTFLPCCTRTDYQLSIRGEYTRALLLTQHHANKKVPLNTEVSSHRSSPWRWKHASRSRESSPIFELILFNIAHVVSIVIVIVVMVVVFVFVVVVIAVAISFDTLGWLVGCSSIRLVQILVNNLIRAVRILPTNHRRKPELTGMRSILDTHSLSNSELF
jgi:hypothetical protein